MSVAPADAIARAGELSKAERLALNEGFLFDRHGRRMMVEEAGPL